MAESVYKRADDDREVGVEWGPRVLDRLPPPAGLPSGISSCCSRCPYNGCSDCPVDLRVWAESNRGDIFDR